MNLCAEAKDGEVDRSSVLWKANCLLTDEACSKPGVTTSSDVDPSMYSGPFSDGYLVLGHMHDCPAVNQGTAPGELSTELRQ